MHWANSATSLRERLSWGTRLCSRKGMSAKMFTSYSVVSSKLPRRCVLSKVTYSSWTSCWVPGRFVPRVIRSRNDLSSMYLDRNSCINTRFLSWEKEMYSEKKMQQLWGTILRRLNAFRWRVKLWLLKRRTFTRNLRVIMTHGLILRRALNRKNKPLSTASVSQTKYRDIIMSWQKICVKKEKKKMSLTR